MNNKRCKKSQKCYYNTDKINNETINKVKLYFSKCKLRVPNNLEVKQIIKDIVEELINSYV